LIVVRAVPMTADPLLGGAVMLLMVLLTPSDVVSTESVVVGGGLVLTAVTLVGHATAGTEN
jgi:hypothetical protein